MVIEVRPHARDSFHDLAKLTIQGKDGSLQTPVKATNKYDHNAKNQIGANISLMGKSNCFLLQEKINPSKLESIMNENGYMAKVILNTTQTFDRFNKGMKLFYPSFTIPAQQTIMDSYSDENRTALIQFLCDVAIELKQEALILPVVWDINKITKITLKSNLQLIPVLDMKDSILDFKKNVKKCINAESNNVPIVALKFSTYAKANLAYRHMMGMLDAMHEREQAVMMVDSPRAIYAEAYNSVSALHYSPFFVADISAERYIGGGGPAGNNLVRLFSKENLATPYADLDKFNIEQEKDVFKHDPKLQELLARIATGKLTKDDWKNSRPRYLSRMHEYVRSHQEFQIMQKNIDSNSARDYLDEKPDMAKVVDLELSNDTSI